MKFLKKIKTLKYIFSKKLFKKIKILKYLFSKEKKLLIKYFFKKPFKHLFSLLKSFFKKPYIKKDNLFLFGIENIKNFKKLAKNKNNQLLIGFSYCQKPINCREKRFSSSCKIDKNNETCRTCFIGKCKNFLENSHLSKNSNFVIITTIHSLIKKIHNLQTKNPNILFLINACFLSIDMFKNFSNALNLKGIAIPLKGGVCRDFKEFINAEKGEKKKTTHIFSEKQFLELFNW